MYSQSSVKGRILVPLAAPPTKMTPLTFDMFAAFCLFLLMEVVIRWTYTGDALCL